MLNSRCGYPTCWPKPITTASHTSSLPDGNRTSDRQLADIADSENRVVVTKDRDFRDSQLLQNQHPYPRICGGSE
jgi:predicted nuclease of predicted toxin-antitoxin system